MAFLINYVAAGTWPISAVVHRNDYAICFLNNICQAEAYQAIFTKQHIPSGQLNPTSVPCVEYRRRIISQCNLFCKSCLERMRQSSVPPKYSSFVHRHMNDMLCPSPTDRPPHPTRPKGWSNLLRTPHAPARHHWFCASYQNIN